MYAGTTIRTKSGRILGTHQQIDRLARRNLRQHLLPKQFFPFAKDILHFEGGNGPDALKRKSPSVDEPWHHVDPNNPKDDALYKLIENHVYNLSAALNSRNQERAAFEAAWLAHAVVDGLTPAHHDQLDQKIEDLWGMKAADRSSFKEKNFIQGFSYIDTISKNWQYWGGKGVFTAHYMFEFGVATTLRSVKYHPRLGPSKNDLVVLEKGNFIDYYQQAVQRVYRLGMYEQFKKTGWTRELARQTKHELLPIIVKSVVLAWYEAMQKSGK